MKKTLFVAVLAVALVLMLSASAFAVGPFFLAGSSYGGPGNLPNAGQNNANYAGYMSWGYVSFGTGNVGLTPHGNYSTTTNKCQVCHAVHRAAATGAGTVLTAIPSAATSATNLNVTAQPTPPTYGSAAVGTFGYTKGCAWCHNTGGFATYITMNNDGSISPHGNCNRCHTASPHGVGGSEYKVLAARLINEQPDLAIAADLASGNNGMDATWFGKVDNSVILNPAKAQLGLTLGTGYLCNGCHSGGSIVSTSGSGANRLAFAVNAAGASPSISGEGAVAASAGQVTGHRVTAVVTDWNGQTATTYTTGVWDPAVARRYNAFYTGGSFWTSVGEAFYANTAGNSTIAWAPANTCQACHDQKTATGDYAFPHGYVNTAGTYVGETPTAGVIWLTIAPDANTAHTVLQRGNGAGSSGATTNANLSNDGLCLKCHVNNVGDGTTAGTAGVGQNF
jgi:hypothetical protein